jgi:peptidoglycan/LPS O-acetylase OafA/YrhL
LLPLPKAHERHAGLDALRAVAILMVIPWHAMGRITNPPLRSFGRYGWAGVDLFFVLSGFLIASQLFQMVKRRGRVEFGRFYLKRSLRILPAYWVVLLLYCVWPGFREAHGLNQPWRFVLFVANMPIVGKAFSHAWSLCVEEHFYLIFPLVVAWFAARSRKLRPEALIAGLFVFGLALRYGLWANLSDFGSKKWDFWYDVYYPSYTRADGLLVGVSIALLREYRPQFWAKISGVPWRIFAAGLGLVALGMVAFDGEKQMTASVFSFPLVSLGFGLVAVAALSPNYWLSRRRIPGAALLATAAYTVYLTHKQMINLAVNLVDQTEEYPFLTILLAISLAALASSLLHFLVEKPGLSLRDWILRRWKREGG